MNKVTDKHYGKLNARKNFLAQDVIYTYRAYATMSVSVRLSACLYVCL